MTDPTDLPDLREIFEDLRRGRHICSEDGRRYFSLQEHQGEFEGLFAALGFKLFFHIHGFYFFQGEAPLSRESNRIGVFFFVLVEHLADRGEYVEEALLSSEFDIGDLPHLSSDRYRELMKEVEVTHADHMVDVVRKMDALGFARRLGDGRFQLRAPAHRLIDLCRSMREAPAANSEVLFVEATRPVEGED